MKTVSALILLVAASLSMAAQTYPSKEYVRLGSRVMAIEAPPTLLPSGESAAANNGETGTPIQITGSPNSSWSASTGAGAITLGATMGMTDSAGVATITYNLAGNAQQTAFTGYILVTMESGTAVYNITQLCCWSDSVTLTPTSANAPAKASNGSVTVGTASNNVSWTVTPQSCFNNSVSPLMGTGGGVISYSLVANTSTNPQTCSFTVAASGGGNSQTFTVTQAGAPGLSESNPTLTLTGPGTYSATVTADGVYTVNVLNWTGWQVTVTAGGAGGWLSTQNITSSSAQYKISGGAGTGTLTFTDGTTTLTLNVTESTSGGSCSSTPTLSLNKSSMSFTAAGGSGQQTSTYSATITSNTNWTASCSNADQEGLTFYVSGNSNTGICTVPLTGSGNQTLYVDLTYNHANPPTALSTTLNVTTCGGSAAKSANITVSQGAETFTVTPGTQTIYQDFDNAPTQFTAYFDGGLPLPTGYSVAWSLSDSSGNSGTINSSGLYLPPNPVPTNFGSVTVTARLSDGSTATAVVSVQANPYAPQASVSPTGQTGSGTVFQFEFNTADGDDPPGTAAINNATMLFSTTATAGTQTPSLAGCYMYIFPGYGVNDSEFELSGQAAYVSTTFPGSTWSKSALWNSDCSVNLAGTESTLYTWATTNGTATSPLFANIPIQFYEGDAGLTGIWATQVENGNTTTYNLFLGNYTVTSPTETVSPSSVTLNSSGQTQQFTGLAAGTTPIPDAVWNAPSAGTISSTGLYTAPNPLTTSQTVSISGKRSSDGSSICCATVVLSPVSVSVSPQSVSLSAGQTQAISATVNGTSNQGVTWNTPSAGTFSNGVYTAPSSIASQQTVTLTATSTVDSTKSGSVTITLMPVAVSLAPTSVSLEINQTQNFTATVTGTTTQTVTWSLSPSGAASGSVSAGLYTAPTTIPTAKTVTITSTSTVDTTKSSSSQISLIADTLAISPISATLTQGQSQQFTATVTGATNTAVTWSMTPTGVGTLSTGGYYTAPTSVTTQQTVVITATSQADASLMQSVNVVLLPYTTVVGTAGTPQSATISTAFGTALQVTVKNTGNNPVSGLIVTFTAPSSGASATFGGSATVTATTNSSGVATAPTLTANTTAGSYTVTASAPGATTPASFSLINTAGPAASIASSAGTPQSVSISTAFAAALQATVKDSSGNLVSGATVTFTAPSSGASAAFAGSAMATAMTNSSGVATAPTLTANPTAGSYTVAASVSGVSTTASFSLTNTAGPPASISSSAGTPQSATISTTFAAALQAAVKDSGGNVVSGATVTFTAPSSGASAAFNGSTTATAATNSSGVATSPALTANATAGSYTITVGVSGVGTPASFSLSNLGLVATPTYNPPGGSYSGAQNVTISSTTAGASIRYTTNGTTPSETNGTLYTGPVAVSSNTTINAIAYETGMSDSSVSSAVYTFNWYNSAWTSRNSVAINYSQVSGTSSLTNFPMLFSITNASFKTVANGGNVGKSDGTDILFTAGDGLTKLNHELEYYNASTGQVIAWVQIPSLSPTANTPIYVYYGNPSASNQQNVTGVWDSNYAGVWHLPNGASLSLNDSTSGHNNGTAQGSPTAIEGQIDGAASFNGSSAYVSVPWPMTPDITTAIQSGTATFCAWVYPTSAGGEHGVVGVGSSSSNGLNLSLRAGEGAFWFSGGTIIQSTSALTLNQWSQVCGVASSLTSVSVYVNGTSVASGRSGLRTFTLTPVNSLLIIGSEGQLGTHAYFPGGLDEVRISNIARSPAWIATEYNNQSSPSTFFTLGGP